MNTIGFTLLKKVLFLPPQFLTKRIPMKNKKNVLILTVLALTVLMTGCFGKKKDAPFFEKTVTFADENWNYEYRIQEFKIEVKSSEKPYKVFFEIEHFQGVDLTDLAFVVSFISPSGGESDRNLMPQYKDILNLDGTCSTVTAYQEKYFNESGVYTFSIYRRYPKYDLYGIKSLTLKLVEIKK